MLDGKGDTATTPGTAGKQSEGKNEGLIVVVVVVVVVLVYHHLYAGYLQSYN